MFTQKAKNLRAANKLIERHKQLRTGDANAAIQLKLNAISLAQYALSKPELQIKILSSIKLSAYTTTDDPRGRETTNTHQEITNLGTALDALKFAIEHDPGIAPAGPGEFTLYWALTNFSRSLLFALIAWTVSAVLLGVKIANTQTGVLLEELLPFLR